MEEGWPTSSSNNRIPQSAHTSAGTQIGCCDSLHGQGCVVSAADVQAALLADVGAAGRFRVAPCAAPCKRPILGHGSFRISSPVQARQRFPGCVRGRAGLVSRLPGASTSQEMAAYLSPLSRYRPIVPRSNGSAASINPHTRPMASGPTPVKSGFWMLNQFQKNRRPTNRKP